MKKRKCISQLLLILTMAGLTVIFLIPLYWTIVMSFDQTVFTEIPTPPRMWPRVVSLSNYQYAFQNVPLIRYTLNTVMISLACTVISLVSGLMSGYAFAKGRFFFKKALFLFILIEMMVPFQTIMIPLYTQYVQWGLIGTYWPIILGYLKYPFGTFLSKQSIESIPDSLREACYIDGGSEWRTFLFIIVPNCGPIIATMCILQIIGSWNSFLWPMIIIKKREMFTLPLGVAMFNSSENVMLLGPRMAVAFLSALPLIVLYLFLQRYIVASVAVSGMKE